MEDDLRTSLSTLAITDVVVDMRTLGLILDAKSMRGISSLAISGSPLGNDVVDLLLSHPHTSGLVSLELSDCGVGDSGLLQLALSDHMPKLKSLVLQYNAFGQGQGEMAQEALLALSRSRHLSSLETLDLVGNIVSIDTILALLSSPSLPALQELCVERGEWSNNRDTLSALRALADQGRRISY